MYQHQPVIKYSGAKWRLVPKLLPYLPKHVHFLDAFFGSGAFFFLKQPALHEVINDVSGDVVNLFRVLRNDGPLLAEQIALTPWARAEYEQSDLVVDDPLERARRFLVRTWQAHASDTAKKTGWRHRGVRQQAAGHSDLWQRLPDRLLAAIDRLRDAEIEQEDAVTLIPKYQGKDVLIYVDPPYLPEVCTQPVYEHMMTVDQHRALLDVVREHTGPLLVSGYASPLYDQALRGWVRHEYWQGAEGGATRCEVVWLNQQMLVQPTLWSLPALRKDQP